MYCKAAATDSIRSFWRMVVMVLEVSRRESGQGRKCAGQEVKNGLENRSD
jgi:hypothetical protein